MIGLKLGLNLGSSLSAANAAWYLLGKADDTDPSFWADFENNRYAVNGVEKPFSDIFTFTRSTTGTRVNSSGLIETVAINQPRFDYDPVTHAPKGILIEEQRTNLLTRSSEFDNAAWIKDGVNVSANSSTAPDGSLSADLISINTTSAFKKAIQQYSASAGIYTFSTYIKAGTVTKTVLYVAGFPITSASVLSGPGIPGAAGSFSGLSSTQWSRIAVTFTATGAGTAQYNIYPGDSHNQSTGDSVYLWGAQLEVGSFPTSYIPTTTASVTRSADSVANTGSNTVPFSSWYNSSAGTVYTDFNYYGSDNSFPRIFDINDTVSNSNMISLLQQTSTQQASYNIYSSSVYQGMSIGAPDLRGSRRKFAGTVALNNAAAVINGGALSTNTSLAMPISLVRMDIGNAHTGTRGACLHIRELRYYPIRVSNTSLQELTT